MVHKGKRAKIDPEMEAIIKNYALKYPRKPRTQLSGELEKIFEGKGLVSPEIETLERKISKYRHETLEFTYKPWTIVALYKYNIPPEALPVILEAWARRQKDDSDLAIIEAVWIGRLYKLFSDLDELMAQASKYAMLEETINRMGDYPDKPETMNWLREKDALLYYTLTGDVSLEDKYKNIMLGYVQKRKEQKGGDAIKKERKILPVETHWGADLWPKPPEQDIDTKKEDMDVILSELTENDIEIITEDT